MGVERALLRPLLLSRRRRSKSTRWKAERTEMSKRNEERGSAHSFCTQGETRPPCCTGLQRFKIKAPLCMQSAVESRNTANHADDPTIKHRGGDGLNTHRLYGGGGLNAHRLYDLTSCSRRTNLRHSQSKLWQSGTVMFQLWGAGLPLRCSVLFFLHGYVYRILTLNRVYLVVSLAF